jgi:hypothetical protein
LFGPPEAPRTVAVKVPAQVFAAAFELVADEADSV